MADGGPRITLRIEIPPERFRELAARLERIPNEMPKVLARAMNIACAKMRAEIVKRAASDLGLKPATVRRRVWFRRARPTRLYARLVGGAIGWPLVDVGFSRQTAAGVEVDLAGKRLNLRHAFLARMKAGHVGVFIRKALASRLPITELRTDSVTQSILDLGADPEIMELGNRILSERLGIETDLLLHGELKA